MSNPLKFAVVVVFTFFVANAVFAGELMTTGNTTSQPIGHIGFCQVNKEECGASEESDPLQLTVDLQKKLIDINSFYNYAIEPTADVGELWEYVETQGDCEDYALLKRRQLIEEGVPASTLLITVVRKPDGEGHAILAVRTNRGDYILDNLTDKIVRWDQTNYRYIKRQSEANAGEWVRIVSQPDAFTASVK